MLVHEVMVTHEVPISSDDWPGKLIMKYGKINRQAYTAARKNPAVTASEAAFASRPYIHPDGSFQSAESVIAAARDLAAVKT